MRQVWNVVKVVFVLFIGVLFIVLIARDVKRVNQLDEQKEIIKMYEEEFLGITGGPGSSEKTEMFTDDESTSVEQLVIELEAIKQRLNNLEQGTVSTEAGEENVYLSIKFPHDGNYYKEAGETQYYSDPACTDKISASDLRFNSSRVDNSNAENGLYIFCLMLDNGNIVYCTQSPWLVTEQEYKEMTTE